MRFFMFLLIPIFIFISGCNSSKTPRNLEQQNSPSSKPLIGNSFATYNSKSTNSIAPKSFATSNSKSVVKTKPVHVDNWWQDKLDKPVKK